ncbi:MAG TPA: phasin family protein [Gammaproteobacteria bacterium]|nr:phasin family protein [Gammaproteobacteria bacterium]
MANNNGGTPFAENPLARLVKASASQAWHVSRDVYSRAGAEGSRLVGGLLNIGGRIDCTAKSSVFEARSSATEAWSRLEGAFVHRVARALNALQIPTARDVHELNGRVAELQKAVVALERRAAQAAPPAGSRSGLRARRKPAARSGKKAAARVRRKAGS